MFFVEAILIFLLSFANAEVDEGGSGPIASPAYPDRIPPSGTPLD